MKSWLIGLMALSLVSCSAVYQTDPRSMGETWDDTAIGVEVAGIANKEPFKTGVRVNAVSYDGKVLLVGQAENTQLRGDLVNKVRRLQSVDEVYDQIRIRPPLALGEVADDTWITTKVKSALIANKKLTDVYVKVLTEDQEVFLLGFVTQAQSDIAADIARNISGVKQVIKAFDYIDGEKPVSQPSPVTDATTQQGPETAPAESTDTVETFKIVDEPPVQ